MKQSISMTTIWSSRTYLIRISSLYLTRFATGSLSYNLLCVLNLNLSSSHSCYFVSDRLSWVIFFLFVPEQTAQGSSHSHICFSGIASFLSSELLASEYFYLDSCMKCLVRIRPGIGRVTFELQHLSFLAGGFLCLAQVH